MTLIARLRRSLNLLNAQNQLIQRQQHLINMYEAELVRVKLEHMREVHGIASAWRIHMETPEIDLRDDITALATTLGNQIAAPEEHVV